MDSHTDEQGWTYVKWEACETWRTHRGSASLTVIRAGGTVTGMVNYYRTGRAIVDGAYCGEELAHDWYPDVEYAKAALEVVAEMYAVIGYETSVRS